MSADQSRTFLITGASRGMGADIAKAALAAGHNVVAAARSPEKVTGAVGEDERLLAVKLDITSADDAQAAADAGVERFGGIDVLVNNAANFYGGFFEELSPAQISKQIETNLIGPMTVTRAVLPVMRRQGSGLVVTISSLAGLTGMEFCSAYAASKFGVEGWMESLTPELEPFGIRTMLVEPGFFATELLEPDSTTYAELSIDDYAERSKETVEGWKGMSGQQPGDPAKLAKSLIDLAGSDEPPLRWVAGSDCVEAAEGKAKTLLAQVESYRELSTSLARDDVPAPS